LAPINGINSKYDGKYWALPLAAVGLEGSK
jgi:hypothetical protein